MKVWPKTAELRKRLRHPTAGGFLDDGGFGEWPEDTFTHRLLVDGDLLTKEPKVKDPKEPKEK